MQEPGRKFALNNSYRFGLNGKEKQAELISDEYDFGARLYEARLGKWISLDPLQAKHAEESPYLYTGGNPIYFIDPDSKDRIEHVRMIGKDGTVLLRTQTVKGAYKAVWNATYTGGGYYTKNDYEVYTTVDYRGKKPTLSITTNTLYGSGHQSEINIWQYFKIKITGNDGPLITQLPQLQIFGSGTSDPGWGEKADPKRPLFSIDFATFESIASLVQTGTSVPNLSKIDTRTLPAILDKARKEALYNEDPHTKEGKPNSEKTIVDNVPKETNMGNGLPIDRIIVRYGPDGRPKDTIVQYNYEQGKKDDTIPAKNNKHP